MFPPRFVAFGRLFFVGFAALLPAALQAQTPTGVVAYAQSQNAIRIAWNTYQAYPGTYFEVLRDNVSVGTTTDFSFIDSGLPPGSGHSYVVRTVSSVGISPSYPVRATTKTPDGSFVMDGYPDFDAQKIESGGCGCGEAADLGLWVAVRGQTLYVATRTIPPNGQYDYFIVISDTLDPADSWIPAPWGKAGMLHMPPGKPFIGAESTNSYVGWFNAPAGSPVIRSADPAGVIEGTLDLVAAFGAVPERIYIAAVAYQTADGGHMVAQSPFGQPADDYLTEFRSPLVAALRDEDQDGYYDRIDPAHGWGISSITLDANGRHVITAPSGPVFTNPVYLLLGSTPGGPFYTYTYATPDDSGFASVTEPSGATTSRFYKMQLQVIH